ncbi:DUF3810 domain-containing protein [Pseudobacteroides cellulosolvens]|uniref:DUF3810 domain-containing protein n=1 Tax=Pseudobacteroides cellulosolvens ATCC 35603 = DSM 2933 TaxID=398512 RepID=A0A0L6JRX6_9FIRM|nr:DUF3810 domain-containing protein [Pseudobacteroides cellulosolvens]KNY28504.1 Protein of unknown function DUF3810 [Pseudobacteroides cellulosolvens ATCC 35603 = DSM 2933]
MDLKIKRKGLLKRFIIIMLIPLGAALFYGTAYTPQLIEKYYSNLLGKKFVQFISTITGIFPFSIMELLEIGLILYIIYNIGMLFYRLVKQKGNRKQITIKFFKKVFVIISIVYIIFIAGWALNYNRYPFSKIASYDTSSVNIDELVEVCDNLIIKTNELRLKVKENQNGIMVLEKGKGNALNTAYKGYEILAKTYPELKGDFGKPKGMLFSKVMSMQGLGGMYCPFTGEANINMDMPDSSIPFVICHEMAHQRGFAREDEANFVGFLASQENPNVEFKYSGAVAALNYAMDALFEKDRERFNTLREKFSQEVNRDLKARNTYWKSFEGVVNKVSNAANDAYLKVNRQKDGTESYGRMVDLLIFQNREQKLFK